MTDKPIRVCAVLDCSNIFADGGTALLYVLICISWGMSAREIIGNGVIGTIAWDWIYGWYQDHDVFYPFKDWFNGWGFQGTDAKPIPFKTARTYRILFDIGRLAFAVGVYQL